MIFNLMGAFGGVDPLKIRRAISRNRFFNDRWSIGLCVAVVGGGAVIGVMFGGMMP